MKKSLDEKIFTGFIYVFLALLAFSTLYPFWNTLVISLNDGTDSMRGGISFWPRVWTLENYKVLIKDVLFFKALLVSVYRAGVGLLLSVTFTSLFAYALSKKELIGRQFYTVVGIITMYFGGGLIPVYLLYRSLHLTNTYAVLVVPSIINVWQMLIFKSFFTNLPAEIEESAKMDGCGYFRTFISIVFPCSTAVFATLSLFTAVNLWNEWFFAGLYINKSTMLPVQNYLINVLNSSRFQEMMAALAQADVTFRQTSATDKSLQMATIIISTIPIIMVYPFIQRYFVKGVMIGAVKG